MPVVFPARCERLTRRAQSLTLLGLTALALVASCSSDTSPSSSVHELDGASVSVGQGSAHTYVITTSDSAVSIGVALTTSALTGLPSSDAEWQLPMPSGVVTPPWDHVVIDWNAQGHPPAVYGLPHFDFHFYTISASEQAGIQGGQDTVTVPAVDVPRDYASGVMAVPDMGVHWVDTLAAEFHGKTFDHTLIYGFYHGKMVFEEPMVTRDFLASDSTATAIIKEPEQFQTSGRYPAMYTVHPDPATGTVRVSLDALTRY